MGIQKREYESIQKEKTEEDFKFNFNYRLQQFQFAIEALNEKLGDSIAKQSSDIKSSEIERQNFQEKCLSKIQEFRIELNNFYIDLNAFQEVVKDSQKKADSFISRSDFEQKISHFNQYIKIIYEEKVAMRREFNNLLERVRSDFDIKLNTQKEEILAAPSELPDLKQSINQKIELVELNGQNAVLRSSNNEKHIMLVERKIENIYQLIKKIDISMQEEK